MSDLNNAITSNDPKSPLSVLETGDNTLSLRYPIEFNPNDSHFMQFMPIEYQRTTRESTSTRTRLADITLPIPANLTTSYGAKWGDINLGIGGKAIANGAGKEALTAAIEGRGGDAVKAISETDLAAIGTAAAPTVIRNLVKSLGDATDSYRQSDQPSSSCIVPGCGLQIS